MTDLTGVSKPESCGGDRVPETTTYLEMLDRTEFRPARAGQTRLTLRRVDAAEFSVGRSLYMDVGAEWLWIDRLAWTDAEWQGYYLRPGIELWVGEADGETTGYFELSTDAGGSTELAYFGLRPGFIGRGLGGQLLSAAVERAWESGARRVWVHTSSRDHRNALDNYLARGFRIYKTETKLASTQPQTE